MGKKRYWNTEVKNKRWLKEGRGQGRGSNYKPWLTVRDVASEGRSHRIFGHLTNRTHHLLSDLELATFLLLQWRSSTIDIREQFPLDLELTMSLSDQLGIKHPSFQGVTQYMSSDFVVDVKEGGRPRFAIQVKHTEALLNPRTIEKLEVERRYWREKSIPFYLVTEAQIPSITFDNINLLYNHSSPLEEADFSSLHTYFEIFQAQLENKHSLKAIDVCMSLDNAYGLESGECLFQLKRLLAHRYFHFDISIPFLNLRFSDLFAENIAKLQERLNVSD